MVGVIYCSQVKKMILKRSMTYEKGNVKKGYAHREACGALAVYIRGAVRSSGNGMRHYVGKSHPLINDKILAIIISIWYYKCKGSTLFSC